MSSIIFTDKSKAPTEAELKDRIGARFDLWPLIFHSMEEICGQVVFEWKFFGKKNGWLGKNTVNGRNMFFFVPVERELKLAFTFGAKAISEIEASNFPETILSSFSRSQTIRRRKNHSVLYR